MLVDTENIQSLIDYYRSLEERFDLFFNVDKGTFVTGSIRHVTAALTTILSELGLLGSKNNFLDAGSGDGRICAIASLLGLQSNGIEYNKDILETSVENIKRLVDKKIIASEKKPNLVQGDIFEPESYTKLGLKFTDFQIIFNFVTYHEMLAEKISSESPEGTVFILHSPCPISFRPEGLQFIREIPLTGIYQMLYIYRK